ncbi:MULTISPECIES: DUF2842 domain-containing protein [Brevundimonas]|jgi:hypothetical protein|uniref:DUF2842 domain-containing protein n=1 Tax=Brevundimonas TaxID=41275 RepID=UPI0015BDDE1E|nr:DUF2842 domain-containing protein [Brevundimonas sp. P7753]NWE54105.1 DUF2842 domain-containing protein [Brevundimonas sp. P7753]
MGARTRRFVATVGVLLFLTFWVWGAVSINDRLPDIWWLDLIFFAVAGIGWGIPLIPMLRWAEREPGAK